MALRLITAPASEPVTVAEAKAHARVVSYDDDDYIATLITAARERLESDTRKALITQTWELHLDAFPIQLPGFGLYEQTIEKVPLQSITSLTYIDTEGNEQTLVEGTDFDVDTVSEPARISPAFDTLWPSTRAVMNAVKVTFVAGYGDAASDVPAKARQAMLLLIGHLYENREQVVIGTITSVVPEGYVRLIAPLVLRYST